MYHTVLIVLHRPPLTLHLSRTATTTPDFEICWASVTALIKLVKQYARGNEYIYLPVTFIHTATAAASIILLKRHILHESNDDEPAKYLNVILEALDGCSATWSAATQAKQAILIADEEARKKLGFRIAEHTNGGNNHSVEAIGMEFENFFDLDFDMGGMGMGSGGVAGFLDPGWWDGVQMMDDEVMME